jgi:hypothetical protein
VLGDPNIANNQQIDGGAQLVVLNTSDTKASPT